VETIQILILFDAAKLLHQNESDECHKSVKFMLYSKHFLLLVLQVIEGKAEK
jgi:hypothetical protein